jgi:hypothetical protein
VPAWGAGSESRLWMQRWLGCCCTEGVGRGLVVGGAAGGLGVALPLFFLKHHTRADACPAR